MSTKSYYQILQVDTSASAEVIEVAYRRLARMYHPDVNREHDAVERMQQLNEAYGVLRDPARRAQYDQTLHTSSAQASSQGSRTATTAESSTRSSGEADYVYPDIPTHCQQCGTSDPTLRFVAFPYVVSVLILTFRRAWGGLYCAKCRRQETLKAKLVTFLFGWWGIPFGPIYSLGVLFGPDDGKPIPDLNAPYLASLGLYFLRHGQRTNAQEAWKGSLHYASDQRLSELYFQVFGSMPDKPAERQGNPVATFAVLGAVALIVAVFSLMQPASRGTVGQPAVSNRTPTPVLSQGVSPTEHAPAGQSQGTRVPSADQSPVVATAKAELLQALMTRAAKAPDQSPVVATAKADLRQALATKAAQPLPSTPKFTATVAGSSVPMFEWPGAAQVIYSLSQGTVTITGKQQDCEWLQIVTAGGEQGWIQTSSGNVNWLSAACSEIPLGHYRPVSGVLADTFPKKGRGELKISNGAADAVVVLTTLDQSVQQSAYVRSGDTFTMRLIPDGNYELYYLSGIDWNGQQFMMQASASKFADSLSFETIREEGGRLRLGWQVTLYPVSDGNAEIIPLDPDEFPIIAVE